MALTQREAILLSALEFQGVFTMGDLVDAVWKRFPDMFRLIGYDLPNNQYVESKVYGVTGLVYRGLLEQMCQREFRLTDKGREAAVALATNHNGTLQQHDLVALAGMRPEAAILALKKWKKSEPATPVPIPIPPVPPLPPVLRRSPWANHLPIHRERP